MINRLLKRDSPGKKFPFLTRRHCPEMFECELDPDMIFLGDRYESFHIFELFSGEHPLQLRLKVEQGNSAPDPDQIAAIFREMPDLFFKHGERFAVIGDVTLKTEIYANRQKRSAAFIFKITRITRTDPDKFIIEHRKTLSLFFIRIELLHS